MGYLRSCLSTKSCLLDPVPTLLRKECVDILIPSVTKLEFVFDIGFFPKNIQEDCCHHLTKKASLPSEDYKNHQDFVSCLN